MDDGTDRFLQCIRYNPRKAWDMVAESFLTDLFGLLDERGIRATLAIEFEDAISNLGKHLNAGDITLYSINRYKRTTRRYPEYDTISTREQVLKWREQVWPDIIDCMNVVSSDICDTIKKVYASDFANDYYSMVGVVDMLSVYGMFYKNIEEINSESSDTEEYDTD